MDAGSREPLPMSSRVWASNQQQHPIGPGARNGWMDGSREAINVVGLMGLEGGERQGSNAVSFWGGFSNN